MYDVDKRRVRHSLGHVLVSLRDLDLTKGDTLWKDLEQNHQVPITYIYETEHIRHDIFNVMMIRKLAQTPRKLMFSFH